MEEINKIRTHYWLECFNVVQTLSVWAASLFNHAVRIEYYKTFIRIKIEKVGGNIFSACFLFLRTLSGRHSKHRTLSDQNAEYTSAPNLNTIAKLVATFTALKRTTKQHQATKNNEFVITIEWTVQIAKN